MRVAPGCTLGRAFGGRDAHRAASPASRGAALGALLVNGAKSFFTQQFPDYWLYFLGLLFVLSTLLLPQGVIGLLKFSRAKRS